MNAKAMADAAGQVTRTAAIKRRMQSNIPRQPAQDQNKQIIDKRKNEM